MGDSLVQYKRDLEIKGFSDRTTYTYVWHVRTYLEYNDQSVDPGSSAQLKDYFHYLVATRKVSRAFMNQSYSALKYYYTVTLEAPWDVLKIPRVKREKKLPDVLSREEVGRMLAGTRNIKHKAILMVTYSAGLRVSEAASLRVEDIDSERMSIKVREAKGNKDRYTLLAQSTLEFLRGYWKMYRPTEWLFEGQVPEAPLCVTTLQRVFTKARDRAEIRKKVSIHSLRHSFATHLLEQGTDIHIVQRLLGHASLRSTMVYLHLTRESLMKVVSPLDYRLDGDKA
jgi:site-specific recombinase XerD